MFQRTIKSRFDPSKYPTEAYQFFYGPGELYYVDDSDTINFPTIQRVHAQTIAQELVSVQPLGPPSDFYERMLESISAAAQAISANSRTASANYVIVSPTIAEQLNHIL